MKFDIWVFETKNCQENASFIKILTGITAVLYMKTNTNVWSYPAHVFLEWQTCQTKVVEKIRMHILCSVTFFLNYAVYEIMWKNIVQRGRPRMTIWHVHISCWITKATHTHSRWKYNSYCFSTATMLA